MMCCNWVLCVNHQKICSEFMIQNMQAWIAPKNWLELMFLAVQQYINKIKNICITNQCWTIKNRKQSVLTEEYWDKFFGINENKSKELFFTIALQSRLSEESAHTVIRLLKLQPCKVTVVPGLTNPDSGTRICFFAVGCWDLCAMGLLTQRHYFSVMNHGCI